MQIRMRVQGDGLRDIEHTEDTDSAGPDECRRGSMSSVLRSKSGLPGRCGRLIESRFHIIRLLLLSVDWATQFWLGSGHFMRDSMLR